MCVCARASTCDAHGAGGQGSGLSSDNTSGAMPVPRRAAPAFAVARALAQPFRAVAASCRAAPSLARAFVQGTPVRRLGLRGGSDSAAAAGVRAMTGSAAAAPEAPASSAGNPLLAMDAFPLYDAVTAEHVMPGMKALIEDAEAALGALETRLAENNYQIECTELLAGLERMSDRIGRAWGVVNHLKAVKDTEALRNAVEAVQPMVVTFNLKTSQSEAVYKAFKAIKESPAFAGLSDAQKRIVENEIRDAQLSGVALEGDKKARFNAIQQELAKLSTTFSNNVLDSTKAFTVRITDKEQVAGLPASALGLASQTAASKGDKDSTPENGPWIFTLDAPSFLPVQQHAKNRELRETMYEKYITRASEKSGAAVSKTGDILGQVKSGAVGKRQGIGMLFKRFTQKLGMGKSKSLDNTPVIDTILALRHERAQLLGMRHHADVSTASKMATFEGAMKLMEDLREKSYDFAVKEMEQLQAFAKGEGFEGELKPWDMTYFAERQREKLYSYQEEDLRPYFSLPRVLDGLFALVTRLFDVEIVAADGKAPVWNKDVRFFQINRNGKPAAYFYLDPYSVCIQAILRSLCVVCPCAIAAARRATT
jgi:oligopeptidase A